MSAPDYKYVSADDWCGLYINGELEIEGHSISASEWLDIIDELIVDHTVDRTDKESDHAYKVIGDCGRCLAHWPDEDES